MFSLEKFNRKLAEINESRPAMWLKFVNGQFTDGVRTYGNELQGKIKKIDSACVEYKNKKSVVYQDVTPQKAVKLGLQTRITVELLVGDQPYAFTVPKNSVIDSLGPYRCMLTAQGLAEREVTTRVYVIKVKKRIYTYHRLIFSRVQD